MENLSLHLGNIQANRSHSLIHVIPNMQNG